MTNVNLGPPVPDTVEEAQRIIKEADSRKVTLRLLGGIAFRLRSPSTLNANLKRKYVDVDFVGLRNQRKEIQTLFTDMGYTPRTTFNAMNGHTRLIFNDIQNERRVDIFLNEFEMCHKFDFTNRLKVDKLTLPLADLLLTKLQVFEITEREYRDVIAFLKDHELSSKDEETEKINAKYVALLCANDWGLYKTITLNLQRIEEALPSYLSDASERSVVKIRIDGLRKWIEEEPKSFKWKMRARVGEKVKWYELPEADREVVDSRPATERAVGNDPTPSPGGTV
jgi:hypothetical protein